MHVPIAIEVLTKLLVCAELSNSAFELHENLISFACSEISQLELGFFIKRIEARLGDAFDYVVIISHESYGM